MKNSLAKAVFCLAAAVTAAAAIDPSVEWMANNGLFGPGQFTDHSNLDVIPGLLIGLFFSAAFVAGIVRRFAQSIDTGSLVKLVPVIFVLQLVVLWSMETLEQIVVIGRPLGGTIWLGGPAVVSLALHAAGCLGFTWLLARMLRWSALTIVAVASFIREIFSSRARGSGARRSRVTDISAARFLEPILARLCGRAPPFLSA
ncbi:MAG TPA: hypothetical protein VGP41_00920 [Candidatus Lustribacter sp.]|nr:hypothetical protein [Candidatus Lustribacter sp.]